jgi:hypothetical protein
LSSLKEALIDLVHGHVNVLVVGSNRAPDVVPFRSDEAIQDITVQSLWYGSRRLLDSYHRAAQTRVVLETGLDSDDGLMLDFVARIQQEAATSLRGSGAWKIWCARNHAEWHAFTPYRNYPAVDAGCVRNIVARRLQICVTPGLTRGAGPRLNEASVAKRLRPLDGFGNHFFEKHDAVRMLPRCGNNTKRLVETACWQFLAPPSTSTSTDTLGSEDQAQAIRSRTPTSAGMKGLLGLDGNMRLLSPDEVRDELDLWNRTVDRFSLDVNTIRRRRREMIDNLPRIIQDAVKGQCTVGHSCKNSSVERLQALLKQTAASS